MDQSSNCYDIKKHGVAGKARGVFEDGVHKFKFLHAIACDACLDRLVETATHSRD